MHELRVGLEKLGCSSRDHIVSCQRVSREDNKKRYVMKIAISFSFLKRVNWLNRINLAATPAQNLLLCTRCVFYEGVTILLPKNSESVHEIHCVKKKK